MPTRTQQGDIMACAYASHGDTRQVCLYPANAEECFHMAVQAFDLAERLQTPVLVLSDLDIGMNDWMCREFKWDDAYRPDRGKMLDKAEVEKLEKFYRYVDKDGDGITYRTLPGVHPKAAYFTRGSGHTQFGMYTEDSAEYQLLLDRLLVKWASAKKFVPRAVIDASAGSELAIVSVGSCDGAVREAMDLLRARGVGLDYMRVRAFPFTEDVERFLAAHQVIFVVEQNRDAQLRSLIVNENGIDPVRLVPILHYDGTPITARFIAGAIGDHQDQLKVTPLRKVKS
jgi:2-oxoglutarate ferredoxin oxidoreductase subunit alpha